MNELEKSIQLAEFYFKESLSINLNAFGELNQNCANSLSRLGIYYHHLGDFDNAEEYLIKALNIDKKLLGINHDEYSNILNELGLPQQYHLFKFIYWLKQVKYRNRNQS